MTHAYRETPTTPTKLSTYGPNMDMHFNLI